LRAFAAQIDARETLLSRQPANINTLADLAAVKDNAHGL
jgi:molybdopterin-guanine dinucleotide biosynthesis protein A